MQDNLPGIEEVVDLLGLVRDPKGRRGDSAFNVRCPFCGDSSSKYKMHINTTINCYRCYKCSGDEKGTGTLDLYARVRMGMRHVKGPSGNGKEILKALLKDMGRDMTSGPVNSKWKAKPAKAPAPTVRALSDAGLNKAYSFIQHYPIFKLSDEHRKKLLARGLDNEAIARNGYASVPESTLWTKDFPEFDALYESEGLAKEKAQYPRLRKKSKGQIVAGLILASEMQKAGITLRGVPGAFQIKGHWCMMYDPGMLIPTRNRKGQIVAFQTRLDRGSLRYMTLSSSGLPEAVDSGISRVHFPLANSSTANAEEVICTEGPLKADLIVHLYGRPVLVFALHGVGNTRELSGLFRQLRIEGVTKVINGFDMDKVLNTNVRNSSKALVDKAKAAGLQMVQRCWDMNTAKEKYKELKPLCESHGISYPKAYDIFSQLALMADSLKAANVSFCTRIVNGEPEHDYWKDETKGMDDYLLSRTK